MRHTQTHEISQVTQKLAIQLHSYVPQPPPKDDYISLSLNLKNSNLSFKK
jgi:hypothetical protein